MEGGAIPPGLDELVEAAAVADFYNMPLFEFARKNRQTREQYGEDAARLEVEVAFEIRARRINKLKETLKP